jgi:uncharacterized protein YabE (DUF348 family)
VSIHRTRAARGHRRKPPQRPDALRELLPRALVLAFLAGGTSTFLAHDKAIRLSVDGHGRTLHTFADDVTELLRQQGLHVTGHDIVAPDPHARLRDGDQVVVRYGRPVSLTVDGRRQRLWTTARTVDEVMGQLGVRADGAYLSASRGDSIGRHGLDLDVRTERTLTFLVDGRERVVRTNAASVGEAARDAGIELRGYDTTSVDPDSFPRDGQMVTVIRITAREEVRDEPIPYGTETRPDPSLLRGTTVVDTPGRPGLRRVRYVQRTVNGVRERPRRFLGEVLLPPVDQIVRVGTKPLSASVAGAEGLDWAALAQCEAAGRPAAVDASGTYGGLYQFDVGTWQGLGGSGRPQDAPAEEQTYRAKRLYVQRGTAPWPACGRKLYR